jgi:hypothetical protein
MLESLPGGPGSVSPCQCPGAESPVSSCTLGLPWSSMVLVPDLGARDCSCPGVQPGHQGLEVLQQTHLL